MARDAISNLRDCCMASLDRTSVRCKPRHCALAHDPRLTIRPTNDSSYGGSGFWKSGTRPAGGVAINLHARFQSPWQYQTSRLLSRQLVPECPLALCYIPPISLWVDERRTVSLLHSLVLSFKIKEAAMGT